MCRHLPRHAECIVLHSANSKSVEYVHFRDEKTRFRDSIRRWQNEDWNPHLSNSGACDLVASVSHQ